MSKAFYSPLLLISGFETKSCETYDGVGMKGLTQGMLANGVDSLRPIRIAFNSIFLSSFASRGGNISLVIQLAQQDLFHFDRISDPGYWLVYVLTSSNQSEKIINRP